MFNVPSSLCEFKDNSDLHQQLAALCVGEKLKLTVDAVTENGATFISDDLVGATITATKYQVLGMSCSDQKM